jgi:hypothetical protein
MAQQTTDMPQAKTFERALAPELGEAQAREIIQEARTRFADLYALRKRHDHRALRQHLEENILPGVALYQTLLNDKGTRANAMELTETAFTGMGAAGRRRMERLGRLPFFYGLMRVLTKPIMRLNFPTEAWRTEWLEVSDNQIAFNLHSCFYLDTLQEYGVPELTAQYCRLDDLTYDGVSPHVRWTRTRTLGRGDDCCDFRFERVRPRS